MKNPTYAPNSRGNAVAVALAFCALALIATSPAFAGPSADIFNNSAAAGVEGGASVKSGWNIALYWVFMFFKGTAVIMTGWGAFELYKGDLKSMAFSFMAAIVLFFSPTIVELAFGIGKAAGS